MSGVLMANSLRYCRHDFWFFKSVLFKEKSALLKEKFIGQENLNNADFSLSNADLKDQKSALLNLNAEKIA